MTVEEIAPDLYRIPVPLPEALLGSVNSYVVKGRERSLVIDTGMNLDSCMEAMEEGFRQAGVEPGMCDFFITHSHPDHFALVSRLVKNGSVVYIDRREAEVVRSVRSGAMFADFRRFVRLTGFPESDLMDILPPEVTRPSKPDETWPFRFVKEGDVIAAGDYRLRCVGTPGHSLGHTCLYEAEKGLFFAGDHLLCGITPGVQARTSGDDPLRDYLGSLERIRPLDVRLVLPGHRDPFTHFAARIGELEEHHRERASEIVAELADGGRSVYEVASAITWNVVDSDSWGSVPDLQKLLATGEAFAHLQYLAGQGTLRCDLRGGRIMFSLS